MTSAVIDLGNTKAGEAVAGALAAIINKHPDTPALHAFIQQQLGMFTIAWHSLATFASMLTATVNAFRL
jgi:hypothetical protein